MPHCDGHRKIDVERRRCPFAKRTFSLLPDGLLPYHHARAATIRVGGRVFEVAPSPAGRHVVARFNPADPARVSVRPLADASAPFVPAFPIK